MNASNPETTTDRDDSEEVEEQFRSLMEGLRTTLPGVQVLFAFLLTMPLQASFDRLRTFDEVMYHLALVSAATSSVLLIAPSAHQRLRAPHTGVQRRHLSHLQTAVRLTIAGTLAAALSICAVIYLASTLVFDDRWAALTTAGIGGLTAWTWFGIPMLRFRES